MENSEVNDYLDTLDETVEESDDLLLGEGAEEIDDVDDEDADEDDSEDDSDFASSSNDFQEQVMTPQAPVVSMDTLPITGEARVDDALGRLADLQGLPVHEHVDVFEDVQRRLHETLADLAGQ
jgi:poly-gamma-glutamate capsule biosynthesis protein CapA/YwtB (metallophosphatase superfamily)